MEEKHSSISQGRLRPGLELKKDYVVKRSDTARFNGNGGLELLSTPILLTWFENAAFDIGALYLPDDTTTVGVHTDFDHLSPTPVGMKVRIKVVLKAVDNRKLTFTYEAWDTVQRIGYGTHERVIVEKTPFMEKILQKRDGRK